MKIRNRRSARSPEDRAELANVLATTAVMAMSFAYVIPFSVLGNSDYASKFENGMLPAGVDGSSGQVAVVMSLGCAVVAGALVVAAAVSRITNAVGAVLLLGALAVTPYALLEYLTWQLAF